MTWVARYPRFVGYLFISGGGFFRQAVIVRSNGHAISIGYKVLQPGGVTGFPLDRHWFRPPNLRQRHGAKPIIRRVAPWIAGHSDHEDRSHFNMLFQFSAKTGWAAVYNVAVDWHLAVQRDISFASDWCVDFTAGVRPFIHDSLLFTETNAVRTVW